MGNLPFTRLTILGLILLLPGAYFALRFGAGFLRVLSRKFRRGVPYLKGSATDYFLYTVGTLAIALLGGALTAAAFLQGRFQPFPGPREVGKVTVEAPKEGRMRLTLSLGGDYPAGASPAIQMPGKSWALEGEFISWGGRFSWLGFQDGHRIEAALGSSSAAGPPEREPESRVIVSGTDPFWYMAHRHPRWLPFLRTFQGRTPWLPAERRSYRLFTSASGYVLVEEREESSEDR